MALAQVESDLGTVNVGQTVAWTVAVTDNSSVAANGTTATFWTINPAGTVTSYVYGTDSEVTRPSTGSYVLTLTVATPGLWRMGFKATDVGSTTDDVAAQGRYRVNPYQGP